MSTSTTSGATRTNPQGLWRRTTLDSYRSRASPTGTSSSTSTSWRAPRTQNWVWAGADVIEPDHSRALISLSRGGLGRRGHARVRHDEREHSSTAGSTLPEAKSQTELGRRGHRAGRAPTSARARSPSPAIRGWSNAGGAANRSSRPRRCSAAIGHRRHRRGVGGPHAGLRADADQPRAGFLQRGGLRTARRRADPHRRPHRRERVDPPQLAADRAAHRLGLHRHRRRALSGRLTAGCRLRRIPRRHSRTAVVFEPDRHTSLHHYAWTRDRLVLVTLADVASRVEV